MAAPELAIQTEQATVLPMPGVEALEEERLAALEARLPAIAGEFKGKSIVSMSQFAREDVDVVFDQADKAFDIEEKGRYFPTLQGKRIARLFYEDSTRTDQSYRFAAGAAGAFIDGFNASEAGGMSFNKGETDEDTFETLNEYAHLLVVRHKDPLFVPERALGTDKPVHNGGNGSIWHPTQALLDGYTIKNRKGRLEGLRVTMQGDLLKGRTVHSLAPLLAMYGVELNFVAPDVVQMPEKIVSEVKDRGVTPTITDNIDEVIGQTDVLYRVRTQRDRFSAEEFERIAPTIKMVTPELLRKAPEDISLLHPRPEDKDNPDFHPDVRKYLHYDVLFQTRMGMVVRRALLGLSLGREL